MWILIARQLSCCLLPYFFSCRIYLNRRWFQYSALREVSEKGRSSTTMMYEARLWMGEGAVLSSGPPGSPEECSLLSHLQIARLFMAIFIIELWPCVCAWSLANRIFLSILAGKDKKKITYIYIKSELARVASRHT